MWKTPVVYILIAGVGWVQLEEVHKNLLDPSHQLPETTNFRLGSPSTGDTGSTNASGWGLRATDNTITEVVNQPEPQAKPGAIKPWRGKPST
jgi:hypothetical protein